MSLEASIGDSLKKKIAEINEKTGGEFNRRYWAAMGVANLVKELNQSQAIAQQELKKIESRSTVQSYVGLIVLLTAFVWIFSSVYVALVAIAIFMLLVVVTNNEKAACRMRIEAHEIEKRVAVATAYGVRMAPFHELIAFESIPNDEEQMLFEKTQRNACYAIFEAIDRLPLS